MKLYYSPTSPFARKARVALRETQCLERCEEIAAQALEDPPGLLFANPLGRVPALVLPDAQTICESDLIVEYIDTLHAGPKLFPETAEARFQMRRDIAMADGLTEAAFQIAIELRRPEARQHAPWIDRKTRAVTRTLAWLEQRGIQETVDAYAITVACALGYCDLRLKNRVDWRASHPGLARWYETFATRPAMVETAPP